MKHYRCRDLKEFYHLETEAAHGARTRGSQAARPLNPSSLSSGDHPKP
ncbi:MAG TPA: hypothetical protein PLY06_07045 [Anaerolineaceae bacterium]|nr:hypothetical protein [Anaerolineaceae bacterium]